MEKKIQKRDKLKRKTRMEKTKPKKDKNDRKINH